ncbi:Pept-C1 domain-containing protein [Aphelenchoides fujianensis]|nr:Pept-C1 domain-containing protein [Aphelenchoides fujianensis]
MFSGGGELLESQSVSTMPSDSEVIIADDFNGSAHTVRHKVIAPVATAHRLLKKKSDCQSGLITVPHVMALGIILFGLMLLCFFVETWWSAKNSDLVWPQHSSEDVLYHQKMVAFVNDPHNKATWTARYNKFASKGMAEEEEKNDPNDSKEKDNEVLKVFDESKYAVFGDTLTYLSGLVKRNDVLPKSFDARLKWPLCTFISRIQNQGSCGSCYTNGIVTGGPFGSFEGCKPYDKSGACGSPCSSDLYIQRDVDKVCERKCQSIYSRPYEEDVIRGRSAYWIKPIPNADEYFPEFMKKVHNIVHNVSYEVLIKRELLLNGPVMACFPVFDDFLHYSTGIYNKTAPDTRLLYGHCAKLIGWGEEGGVGFWLYANSWVTRLGRERLLPSAHRKHSGGRWPPVFFDRRFVYILPFFS